MLDQLKKVTQTMKDNQKLIDQGASRTSKNADFLFGNRDMEMLDRMVASQLNRDNMYRDNSIVFHCGENAKLCKKAYIRWVKSLRQEFEALMLDEKANALDELDDLLTHNRDTISAAV